MEQLGMIIQQTSSTVSLKYQGLADSALQKVKTCLEQCPTEQSFQNKYNIQRTHEYVTRYKDRMIFGNAPTLTTISNAYSDAALFDWLNALVLDYALFCGEAKKANAFQIDSISHTIAQTYPYLKATEVMLFFSMAKGSQLRDKYGDDSMKMYGTFSGQSIMAALKVFMEYRYNEIDKHEKEEKKQQEEEWQSAQSSVIQPLLKKMREDMEAKSKAIKAQRDKERQRIIDEHNREFQKMLQSQQYISK